MLFLLLSTLIFLLLPKDLFAWGPGTHVEIAFRLLENVALFAPAVRAIIAGREDWFVYGSVAADIIVGKKFAGEHDHCHNWRVGEMVLKAAKTDRERAAAYGYLSHLACDVVSHNYFIPFKVIESYKARFISHTYWEMRFDIGVRPAVWKKMNRMIVGDFSPFDRLLEKVLKRALFSFKTSKTIFSGILAFQKMKRLRATFSLYAKNSRFELDTKEITNYLRLALEFSTEYLKDPRSAKCLNFDPTGNERIKYALKTRIRFRRSLKNRSLTKTEIEDQIKKIKQELKNYLLPLN